MMNVVLMNGSSPKAQKSPETTSIRPHPV